MSKLTGFIKQHIAWVVMFVVAVPLLIILVVQYRSLVQLGQALPIAQRDSIRKYLATLTSRIEDVYRGSAEQTLSIPPDVFAAERFQDRVDGIVAYFQQHPAKGAKQLFIVFIKETRGKTVYSAVHFFDPSAAYQPANNLSPAPWQAAYSASGHYLCPTIAERVSQVIPITVNEQVPENRAIAKPVLGSDSTVLGVAGMIVDETYFKEEILPGLVESSLQTFFPDDHHNLIITLQDESGNRLFESQPSEGKDYEVAEPLRFIFRDLSLRVVIRSTSMEQQAGRVVMVNLSLSIVMTGLLLAGIYLALRTAAREMKLSRMKVDFVSNVSHELRTPLASIRVFGEFFKAGWVNEPQKSREYGEYIEKESRRLTHLINNILDFSKLESGVKAYEFRKADMKEIVEETLEVVAGRLGQSHFNFVLQVPEKVLPQAIVNRDAITQSLVNLIDNAIKYSGASQEVVIRLDQEDGYVTISVTDFGIGIPRDEQRRIFDKFYRVSTGLVHDVKGSGLGLAIVKHIMDAHQGKITVKSQPGFGSTFTMHFPCDYVSIENEYEVT